MATDTTDERRAVAKAWRDAWSADEDGYGPADICEGCSLPATTTDGSEDGVALCDTCAGKLEREWAAGARALLFRVLETAGHPRAGIPLYDDIRRHLGSEETP